MASRDGAAFAEFVLAWSPAVHRAAYLMVGDVGLAQDLVQEALTKTYVAWPRLRDQVAAGLDKLRAQVSDLFLPEPDEPDEAVAR